MPGNEYDIPSWRYFVLPESHPHRFTHPPLDPVAGYRVSDPPPDGKAKAAVCQVVRQNRDHHQRMDLSAAFTSETYKVGIGSKTILPAHDVPGQQRLHYQPGLDPMLDRQAMATLLPPGLEDSTPPLGFHPCPKSVLALAAPHLGLPRSFRHCNPSPVRFTAGNYTFFFHCLQI
jgi:hypothetical protein